MLKKFEISMLVNADYLDEDTKSSNFDLVGKWMQCIKENKIDSIEDFLVALGVNETDKNLIKNVQNKL